MKVIPVILLLSLIFFTGIADAKTIHVSPTGSNSDQKIINDALKETANNGGGTVYLENSGTNYVFITNGPIVIPSGNIVLTGDPDITVRVYSGSDATRWFTGTNSIITANGQIDNLEIYGFKIDGSCDKLPFNFHHSRSDTKHDCERAIYVQGSTGRFNNNIKIHDMSISNCFSDGIHVRFANNVHCYSNFISNCQHEGLFWTSIINGLMENNQVAGITSDCARLDNCVSVIVQNNYFFSYSGNKNSQAPKGEQKGIQISDAGASQGYDASNKPTHTTDIEVRWNTFANTGETAVWLDSTGKGYDNVYIHENKFVNVNSFTNDGTSVTLDMEVTDTPEYHDYSSKVEPTVDVSKQVFSSIFDFLDMNFYTSACENDSIILPEGTPNSPSEISGTIEYYKVEDNYTTIINIPTEGLSEIQYLINGKVATHTLMLGERSNNTVFFTETSIWEGDFSHEGNSLKIPGNIPQDQINIKCITPTGKELTPTLKTKNTEFEFVIPHPAAILLILVLLLAILFFNFSLKHML